jgi:hypothetical protein
MILIPPKELKHMAKVLPRFNIREFVQNLIRGKNVSLTGRK